MSETIYPGDFYQNRRAHTLYSAQKILPLLTSILDMHSVADIGCGTGTWLSAARACGAQKLFGIEGEWLTPDMLDDTRIHLATQNLEQQFFQTRVDLTLSLEVAEHLSPERADSFVDDLTRSAPAILFAAAIPGQGGVNHLNEQWQSYWAQKFIDRGFLPFDIVRPAVWTDPEIPAWYKQNIILYLDTASAKRSGLVPVSNPKQLDIVHPLFWERANRELKHAGAIPESEYLKQT